MICLPVKVNSKEPGFIETTVDEATHIKIKYPNPVGVLYIPIHSKESKRQVAHSWLWNGSVDAPTLNPSLLTTLPSGIKFHSFLTDGKINFLDDTQHTLKNQTVNLEPL